jgi:predicted TIM-barrel fold metal-dependent hydrolase
MPPTRLLDCNLTVGRRSTPRPENDLDVAAILAALDHAGIAGGLAYHAHAREYDPLQGNACLQEIVAATPRLLPCFVVLPPGTGDFPGGEALLRYLETGGARAVRLFPRDHGYVFGETWVGGLLGTLEEAGVPVLIDLDQTDWREIDECLAAHPRLRLVVLRVGYRIDRMVYPLLDEHPGLRLESAFYPLHGGLESMVARFGAGRLVFGTGLPLWDPGAAISHLLYAALPPAAQAEIGALNLEALLWSRTAPRPALTLATPALPGEGFWAQVRRGQPLAGVAVIDAHAHLGAWPAFRIAGDPWAAGMVAAMDACGISQAVIAPHLAIGPDMSAGNNQAAAAVQQFPDRLAAYCTISPNYPEGEVVAELNRCLTQDCFRGIKLHPTTHDYPANGPRYRPAWAMAHERELPVLIHTWDGDARCRPSLFEAIAHEFPRARVILGHSGATPSGIREAIQAARNAPNIFLDLTKSLMHYGMVEEMVAGVGADRVLFGTDLPFIGCTSQMGHVAAAHIPDEDKARIFGQNARRLFGL